MTPLCPATRKGSITSGVTSPLLGRAWTGFVPASSGSRMSMPVHVDPSRAAAGGSPFGSRPVTPASCCAGSCAPHGPSGRTPTGSIPNRHPRGRRWSLPVTVDRPLTAHTCLELGLPTLSAHGAGGPLVSHVFAGARTSWCRTWAVNPWPAAVSNVRDSWKRPPRCSSRCGSARERMRKQSRLRRPMRPDRCTTQREAARRHSVRGSQSGPGWLARRGGEAVARCTPCLLAPGIGYGP